MRLFVSHSVVLEGKSLPTKAALLCFGILPLFSKMSLLVLIAFVTACENFATMCAKITLQSDMNVGPISIWPCECFTTHMALIRVNSSMDGLLVRQHGASP
jgi:hypothetical protein